MPTISTKITASCIVLNFDETVSPYSPVSAYNMGSHWQFREVSPGRRITHDKQMTAADNLMIRLCKAFSRRTWYCRVWRLQTTHMYVHRYQGAIQIHSEHCNNSISITDIVDMRVIKNHRSGDPSQLAVLIVTLKSPDLKKGFYNIARQWRMPASRSTTGHSRPHLLINISPGLSTRGMGAASFASAFRCCRDGISHAARIIAKHAAPHKNRPLFRSDAISCPHDTWKLKLIAKYVYPIYTTVRTFHFSALCCTCCFRNFEAPTWWRVSGVIRLLPTIAAIAPDWVCSW
jgi:hypothetical protein